MVTVRSFQAFEEKLDRGASWPDLDDQVVALGPGADRALGAPDQGVVGPQAGRRPPRAWLCMRGRCGWDDVGWPGLSGSLRIVACKLSS